MTVSGVIDFESCPHGSLSIEGTVLHTPAYHLPNLIELWLPGEVRGSNRLIPGAPGVVPYPRRPTETNLSLPMVLSGIADRFGVLNDDHWVGLQETIDFLRSTVLDQPGTLTGARTAILTMPNGTHRAGPMHILKLVPGNIVDSVLRATLEVSLPGAYLRPVDEPEGS